MGGGSLYINVRGRCEVGGGLLYINCHRQSDSSEANGGKLLHQAKL